MLIFVVVEYRNFQKVVQMGRCWYWSIPPDQTASLSLDFEIAQSIQVDDLSQ